MEANSRHFHAECVFKEIFIENPRVQQAHNVMERLCQRSLNDAVIEKSCAALIGPSQSGKTSTIRSFVERKNTLEAIKDHQIPVLHLVIGSNITRKGFLQEALIAMEDYDIATLPKSGTESILLHRFCVALRALNVQLLVVDECHHIKRGSDGRYAYDVGEMLKSILLRGACSILLAGVGEDAEAPFRHNEQLALRALRRLDFSPLRASVPEDHELFQNFVVDMLMEMSDRGLINNAEALATRENLYALHQASSGVVGRVCRLFRLAVGHMIDRNDEGLSIEDLIYATDVLQQHNATRSKNPFQQAAYAR